MRKQLPTVTNNASASAASKTVLVSNTGMLSFGLQLVTLRGDRTREEMAALLDISCAEWADYETGRSLPSAALMKRLAIALGLSYRQVLAGMKGIFGGFPLPTMPRSYNRKDAPEIDIDLYKRCLDVAALMVGSTSLARVVAVRTYNAMQSGLAVVDGLTVGEVAALLLATDSPV